MTTSSSTASERYVDPIERLAIVMWVRAPRALIRRLPSAWGVAGDGHPLVSVPPVAVLAPIAVTLGFFLAGAGQLGYEQVYTESLVFLIAAVAVGVFSAQLGVLAVVSFAVGELLFSGGRSLAAYGRFRPTVAVDGVAEAALRLWLPMVITYLLLAVAVVVVPRTARALLSAAGRWRAIPTVLAWPLASVVFVVVVWMGLSIWVAAAPTLVRPRFTWLGGEPTVEAIRAIQGQGDEIVAFGVMAGIARQLLIGLSMWWAPVRDRVRFAESDPVPAERLGGRSRHSGRLLPDNRVRRMLGDIGMTVLATLVLAGVLEQAWLWVAVFSVFLTVRLLRSGVVAVPALEQWKRITSRVPAVARAVALWFVARLMTDALAKGRITSYTGIAVVVIVMSVVVFAVFPGTPRTPDDGDGSGDGTAAGGSGSGGIGSTASGSAGERLPSDTGAKGPESGPMPRQRRGRDVAVRLGGATAGTWLVIALVAVLTADAAFADNCGTFSDCFGQTGSAADATFGLAMLAAFSLALDFTPIVGDVKGVVEGVTGRDLITGEELSPWERALGFIPFVPAADAARFAAKADDIVDLATTVSRHGDEVVDSARHGDDLASTGRGTDAGAAGGAGRPPRDGGSGGTGGGGGRPPDDGRPPRTPDDEPPRAPTGQGPVARATEGPALRDVEIDTAHRFEEANPGTRLYDYEARTRQADYDYYDQDGRIYDQVGNPRGSPYLDMGEFTDSLHDHAIKMTSLPDHQRGSVIVDLTGFTDAQKQAVTAYLDTGIEAGFRHLFTRIGF